MSIHIKKSHRGLLHKNLGVAQGEKIPASKLKVKSTDSPAVKKRKIFAQNAKKWHHADGGLIEYDEGGKVYNPNLPCQMGNVQAPIPYDPNVETLKVVGGTVSSAVVPLVIGNTVKSLGNNIQAAGTAGYAYIQAPNTTTTTTTSTVTKTADNGSNIDGTQSNTVAPVTTTSTDNHAIDNHSNSSTVYNPVPLNMP